MIDEPDDLPPIPWYIALATATAIAAVVGFTALLVIVAARPLR